MHSDMMLDCWWVHTLTISNGGKEQQVGTSNHAYAVSQPAAFDQGKCQTSVIVPKT